ncbi:hypothetical protein QE152_g8584 [Popillia japonica]|uniref:Uncharacterized protein n=1 Tax=Popillia japonica TaxID=7064 RepID=A0AAW1M2D2_POPJA
MTDALQPLGDIRLLKAPWMDILELNKINANVAKPNKAIQKCSFVKHILKFSMLHFTKRINSRSELINLDDTPRVDIIQVVSVSLDSCQSSMNIQVVSVSLDSCQSSMNNVIRRSSIIDRDKRAAVELPLRPARKPINLRVSTTNRFI